MSLVELYTPHMNLLISPFTNETLSKGMKQHHFIELDRLRTRVGRSVGVEFGQSLDGMSSFVTNDERKADQQRDFLTEE